MMFMVRKWEGEEKIIFKVREKPGNFIFVNAVFVLAGKIRKYVISEYPLCFSLDQEAAYNGAY